MVVWLTLTTPKKIEEKSKIKNVLMAFPMIKDCIEFRYSIRILLLEGILLGHGTAWDELCAKMAAVHLNDQPDVVFWDLK